jgi:hypothetical protein
VVGLADLAAVFAGASSHADLVYGARKWSPDEPRLSAPTRSPFRLGDPLDVVAFDEPPGRSSPAARP